MQPTLSRARLFGAFLIVLIASFNAFGQINTQTNFKPAIAAPIDARTQIATLADTATVLLPYEGMLVYVQATKTRREYKDGVWQVFSAGGGGGIVEETDPVALSAVADSAAAIRGDIPGLAEVDVFAETAGYIKNETDPVASVAVAAEASARAAAISAEVTARNAAIAAEATARGTAIAAEATARTAAIATETTNRNTAIAAEASARTAAIAANSTADQGYTNTRETAIRNAVVDTAAAIRAYYTTLPPGPIGLPGQPGPPGQDTTANLYAEVINLNDNQKWVEGIEIASYLTQRQFTYLDANPASFTVQPNLIGRASHNFGYTGNAMTFTTTAGNSTDIRVVLPTKAGVILTGDTFTVLVELSSSKTGSVYFSLRASTLANMQGQTVSFTANVPKIVRFEVQATNSVGKFILLFSGAENLWKDNTVRIGRITVTKGTSANINGYSTEIISDLIGKGLIAKPGQPSPRNLLHVNRQEVEPSFRSSLILPKPGINLFYTHTGYDQNNVNSHVRHQASQFDYDGNEMVIDPPGTSGNFFFYILTSEEELLADPVSTKLYLNFEIRASQAISVNVSATNNNGVVIGTNLGAVPMTTSTQVINLEIDRSLITSPQTQFGIRLIIPLTAADEKVYVGRVVLSDVITTSIDLPSIAATHLSPTPKKVGELGDSKVAQQRSTPFFCIKTGNWMSSEEVDSGKGGLDPTGVGGSRIIPIGGNVNSIYRRADDFVLYDHEVIILYGGANDPRNTWVAANLWGNILGDVTEDAYEGTGSELDSAGYHNYWVSVNSGTPRNPSSAYDVTFAAVYKGIIEKIQTAKPSARIYLKTVLIMSGGQSYQDTVWGPMNDLIRSIGKYYSIPVIDAANEAGVNQINQSVYFDDTVHENLSGGLRISDVMVRAIYD